VPSKNGESAVAVPVPAAEPVISTWRAQFDPSAAEGMPAHITALYPFVPADRLTFAVAQQLRDLCAAVPVLDVEFRHTGRFPEVLYLDPEPAGHLRELTAAIAERWPEAPPYSGMVDEVVPHLTVARGVFGSVFDEIEADVARRLPLRTRLAEAGLYVFERERWRRRLRLPFRGSGSA
jgi:2'-5' RNA ligase